MIVLLSVDLDPALAVLRPLGGFFVLHASRPSPPRPLPTLAHAYAPDYGETGPDVHAPVPPGRPGDRLADPLAHRVRRVADALRAPEARVAASVAQQGLAARLWSVALACAAFTGRVPDLAPDLLCWDPDATAPDDLWLAGVRSARPADTAALADVVLTAHLAPLTAAVHDRYGVAAGLLWGNAASALAGAGRELDRWARRHGHADAAGRAGALTAGLLAHPLLAGTGTLTGTAFRRRSCCLYYRVPGAGVCGDCCFPQPPGPRESQSRQPQSRQPGTPPPGSSRSPQAPRSS
ncbi:(2Fe-2S)-binding protein [Streptomyces sp. NPDC015140]|uniref:(2Fe-2S)-binding protein n=1 Tax=Streptomyces sp. NPDC015140 TaxID=3364943 RepID=UPI0036F57C11